MPQIIELNDESSLKQAECRYRQQASRWINLDPTSAHNEYLELFNYGSSIINSKSSDMIGLAVVTAGLEYLYMFACNRLELPKWDFDVGAKLDQAMQ